MQLIVWSKLYEWAKCSKLCETNKQPSKYVFLNSNFGGLISEVNKIIFFFLHFKRTFKCNKIIERSNWIVSFLSLNYPSKTFIDVIELILKPM